MTIDVQDTGNPLLAALIRSRGSPARWPAARPGAVRVVPVSARSVVEEAAKDRRDQVGLVVTGAPRASPGTRR
jgi:hypothetical protein